MAFVSAVNQPERVFLNSNDDNTPPTEALIAGEGLAGNGFSKFTCRLPTPILNPKRTQLLRAAIPNAQVNIPDYDLIFWYFAIPVAPAPQVPVLRNVRIFPSNYQGATGGCAVNRQLASYADLVTLLNQSAAATDTSGNPYHVAGDITFAYDANTKKISWQGTNIGFAYAQAGYNDPQVEVDRFNVRYTAGGAVQPTLSETNLNLRSGFTFYDTEASNPNTFLVTYPSGTPVVAPSWANLVYSQCVYMFANIVAGSGMGSGGQHNLLSVVPMNAPSLGVSLYQAPMVNWLTKVPQEIYEITIYMLDDNYQPFVVPNNAIVNIEMGFSYVNL